MSELLKEMRGPEWDDIVEVQTVKDLIERLSNYDQCNDSDVDDAITWLKILLAQPRITTKMLKSLRGAVVDYDALPYEMATPECDRLERAYVTVGDRSHLGYVLDWRAAVDFVMQSVPDGDSK